MKLTLATSKYISAFAALSALCTYAHSQACFAAPAKTPPAPGSPADPLAKPLVPYRDPKLLKLSPDCLELYNREPNNEIAFWKAGNYLLKTAKIVEVKNLKFSILSRVLTLHARARFKARFLLLLFYSFFWRHTSGGFRTLD